MCRSSIEESEDQDASRMQAKLTFVPIDQMATYISNKVRRCARRPACCTSRLLAVTQGWVVWGESAPKHLLAGAAQRLFDVLAVVTAVGPLGSIKRKSDQSELIRRDVTLVDSTCALHDT